MNITIEVKAKSGTNIYRSHMAETVPNRKIVPPGYEYYERWKPGGDVLTIKHEWLDQKTGHYTYVKWREFTANEFNNGYISVHQMTLQATKEILTRPNTNIKKENSLVQKVWKNITNKEDRILPIWKDRVRVQISKMIRRSIIVKEDKGKFLCKGIPKTQKNQKQGGGGSSPEEPEKD